MALQADGSVWQQAEHGITGAWQQAEHGIKGQLSGSGRAVTTIRRFAKTTNTVARNYPMCVHLRLKEYLKITETRNNEVNSKNLTKIADSIRESQKYGMPVISPCF